MGGRLRLLMTCFLPSSPALVDTLNLLAQRISELGGRLVFMAADSGFSQKVNSEFVDFEPLAGGLAAYARPDAYMVAEEEGQYEAALADVDANWGGQADSASVLLSLAGVETCRHAAREAFARHRPAVALLWSAAMFPASRVWRDMARELGILSFNVERGLLPGTWMLDSEGMYDQSDVLINLALRKLLHEHTSAARYEEYKEWYLTGRPRKYGEAGNGPQALRARLKPKGLVVCAFGGLDTGANGHGLSVASRPEGIVSSQDILAALQKISLGCDATVFFKAHPGAATRVVPGLHGQVLVLESKEDPIDLMLMADVVVTGTTSLAYEALLLERPLVQTVEGPLKGIVPLARSAAELSEGILSELSKGRDISDLTRRRFFLDALLTHYFFAVQPDVPARPLDELAVHLIDLGEGRTSWYEDGGEAEKPDGKKSVEPRTQFLNGVIYFDLGDGFSEQSAYRWGVWPGAGVASCLVPVPAGVISLRLDPADHPCIVRMFDAVWLDADSQTVHVSTLGELAQDCSEIQAQVRNVGQREVLDLVCTGNDPHFALSLPDHVAQRLKKSHLQLRLTYSVWSFSEGVALQPANVFHEIRAGAESVAASLVSADSRNQERIAEVRGALSELRQFAGDVLPSDMRESVSGIEERLRHQLEDAVNALLTAQQGMGEYLSRSLKVTSSQLNDHQLDLHRDTRETLARSVGAALELIDEILQRINRLGGELSSQVTGCAQAQIDEVVSLGTAQAELLKQEFVSVCEQQKAHMSQLGSDLSSHIREQSQFQIDSITRFESAQVERLQQSVLSVREQQKQEMGQLGSGLTSLITNQAQSQTEALLRLDAAQMERLQNGLSSLRELQLAHAEQFLQGHHKILEDALAQLKSSQNERKELAVALDASTRALALARSKLGILENSMVLRLVRSLCRLPKDVFKA